MITKLGDFPVYKTKMAGVTRKFDLNSPAERKEYFEAKVGAEIEKLRRYLEANTFVAFLLGKKNSGKGTYSKLFMEAVGKEHVGHLAVGDVVRDAHEAIEKGEGKNELLEFLKKNYRGFHGVHELEDIILGRSTETLVSSELIVALIKYEISKRPRRALFIDGFPRALDQIGYSLFLKEIIGYRTDPDFLVFISVPEAVVDERIKYRVICPQCKTPRNTKLAPTETIGHDEATKEFYLICDNRDCPGMGKARMVRKEGDELGIEPIRARLEVDEKIMRELLKLSGIPKMYLRNSVPVSLAEEYVEDYELTPVYSYEFDGATQEVKIIESPWIIQDDDGIESYSHLPAAVALALIKQTASTLEL